MRRLINWITCKVKGHQWLNSGGMGWRQKNCQRCGRTEYYAFDFESGYWLAQD